MSSTSRKQYKQNEQDEQYEQNEQYEQSLQSLQVLLAYLRVDFRAFLYFILHCTARTGSTDGQRTGSREIVEHGQDSLRQLWGFLADGHIGIGYDD